MRTIVILFSVLFILSSTSCATYVEARPANVTIIKSTPKRYKIVKVKGKRYYFWNGNHYRKTNKGYVIVRV
ncbi:DUF6515 family protein [Jejuia spongiicola]|uniref:Uncharacterized protein n=1 Tax=Jejuia spongiicola TaxID=2942207 RepID=A0ABT0QBP3_9FLAO|nr:DUF6515 family protein [Jejuia spongiicola]MCL6293380.1 hypothetical protein [Jejuia spongiicola]